MGSPLGKKIQDGTGHSVVANTLYNIFADSDRRASALNMAYDQNGTASSRSRNAIANHLEPHSLPKINNTVGLWV